MATLRKKVPENVFNLFSSGDWGRGIGVIGDPFDVHPSAPSYMKRFKPKSSVNIPVDSGAVTDSQFLLFRVLQFCLAY